MGNWTFFTSVSVLHLLEMGSADCHFFLPGNRLYLNDLPDTEGTAEGLQTYPWLRKRSWKTTGVV